MVTKKVSKKVTRKFSKAAAKVSEEEKVPPVEEQKKSPSSKFCAFCKSETSPEFTDLEKIKRFITDRNRILPKMRSGLCAKHQRVLTRQIKYARHLALLPFTPKV